MPKTIRSTRRTIANRKNAQKSTGPKTQRGKKRSSQNAIKHGLLARETLILEGNAAESAADFDTLLAKLHTDFNPADGIEQMLVERVAASLWRLRRAHRYEVGCIRQSLHDSQTAPTPAATPFSGDPKGSALSPPPETVESITKRIEQAQSELSDDRADLDWAKEHQDLTTEEAYETIPYAWERIERDHDVKLQYGDSVTGGHSNFKSTLQRLDLTGTRLRAAVLAALNDQIATRRNALETLAAKREAVQRNDRLRRERHALIASIPADDALDKLVRYENMLDREFHRALSALHRAQRDRAPHQIPPSTAPIRTANVNERTIPPATAEKPPPQQPLPAQSPSAASPPTMTKQTHLKAPLQESPLESPAALVRPLAIRCSPFRVPPPSVLPASIPFPSPVFRFSTFGFRCSTFGFRFSSVPSSGQSPRQRPPGPRAIPRARRARSVQVCSTETTITPALWERGRKRRTVYQPWELNAPAGYRKPK